MKNLYAVYKTSGKDFRYSYGHVADDYTGKGFKELSDWLVANKVFAPKNGEQVLKLAKAFCRVTTVEEIAV